MKQLLVLLLMTRAVAQPPAVLVAGRVTGYVTNRIGDYDGLRLQPAAGDPVALRFPAHAAGRVLKTGPVGRQVEAEVRLPHAGPEETGGHRDHKGHGRGNPLRLVRLSQPATGTFVDLRDVPPPPPQAGTLVQVTGRLTGTLTDERGHVVGLLVDKTYLLELRPHQSDLLRTLLSPGDPLGFSGYQRPPAGFVNQTGRAVVRPQSLTIDGKTYAF